MTDRFADINSIGESGRNPITNAGRVAINGHLNEEEILQRIDNYTRGNTLYPGPTGDVVWTIFPREICLEEKIESTGTRNKHKMHAPFVLATANAMGNKGDKVWELVEQMEYRGVAGGQGAKYDRQGDSPEIDLSLVQGGVITLRNTGPKRIENNKWVYWGLPDPASPYDRGIRGSQRMPFTTHQYDPTLDKLTEETLADIMMSSPSAVNGFEQEHRWPIQEGAENMKLVIAQIYLGALHTFLMSGLVKFDGNAINNPQLRQQNAASYSQNQDARKNLLRFIGAALGARDLQSKASDAKITFRVDLTSDRQTSLKEYALDVFLARKDSALVLPLTEGTRALPSGDAGILIKNQKATISDLFAAINKTNHYTTRRIFCKTIVPSEPGKEFDALLMRYSS